MSGALDPQAWPHGERRHRVLTDDDVQAIAESLADQLVARLADERTAERVVTVWSGHLDKQIGKGVRRLLVYVALGLLGLAAVKFDLWSRLISLGR